MYLHVPIREKSLDAFVQTLYAALSSLSDTCLAFILTNGNVRNTVEKLDCPFSSEAKRCEAEIAAKPRQRYTHTLLYTQAQGYAVLYLIRAFVDFGNDVPEYKVSCI